MNDKTIVEGGQQDDSEEIIDKVLDFDESFRRNNGNHNIIVRPFSNAS